VSEDARPALDGIRVVDFSQVAAGPYLTSLLGDMGADVIKVEPLEGDSVRGVDDAFGPRRSSYFFGVNRSKRDLALNLRAEAARGIVQRLAGRADVLITGMRPAAAARAGLDYAALAVLNPRLIHVSITAFGESGPRAAEPGMDILAQALSGVMGLTGEPGRPPVRVGPPVTDVTTSLLGCFAVCAALVARERDGIGQSISLNLLDSALALLPNYAVAYLHDRRPIRPEGGAHPQIVPYQVFASADGFMVVACLSDRFWDPLCAAIERPDLSEHPDYRTNVDRVKHRTALVGLLSELFRTQSTAHWMGRLHAADVPCSEVHPIDQVFDDPQVIHNGMAIQLSHPVAGGYLTVANPIRMSRTPPQPAGHAPDTGEHSREILAELGYSAMEIGELIDSRVVGSTQTD
jgi:crotonobetainyl-CoA:carnitine CoA-transferase CaiB-like acyl-CoA transferase